MANVYHAKLTWGGSMGTPAQEIWTNSLTILLTSGSGLPGEPLSLAQQESALAQIQVALAAFHGGNSGMNPAFKLEWAKLNTIGIDGKYYYDTTTRYDYASPVIPTGTTSASWRVTTAVTLRSNRARGAGHAGRFYPPYNTSTNQSVDTPYMTPTAAQSLALKAQTLIQAINDVTFTGDAPTFVVGSAPIQPTMEQAQAAALPYISVEVDRVIDTQRRRTNRVPRLASIKYPLTP